MCSHPPRAKTLPENLDPRTRNAKPRVPSQGPRGQVITFGGTTTRKGFSSFFPTWGSQGLSLSSGSLSSRPSAAYVLQQGKPSHHSPCPRLLPSGAPFKVPAVQGLSSTRNTSGLGARGEGSGARMAMGEGSGKRWRPTGVTGMKLPRPADLGSSRPQFMPGSCLLEGGSPSLGGPTRSAGRL